MVLWEVDCAVCAFMEIVGLQFCKLVKQTITLRFALYHLEFRHDFEDRKRVNDICSLSHF